MSPDRPSAGTGAVQGNPRGLASWRAGSSVTQPEDPTPAGCEATDVLARLNLTMSDLFIDGQQSHTRASGSSCERTIRAVYTYRSVDGRPLFEVVRLQPKSFAIRRPGGKWALDSQTSQPILEVRNQIT